MDAQGEVVRCFQVWFHVNLVFYVWLLLICFRDHPCKMVRGKSEHVVVLAVKFLLVENSFHCPDVVCVSHNGKDRPRGDEKQAAEEFFVFFGEKGEDWKYDAVAGNEDCSEDLSVFVLYPCFVSGAVEGPGRKEGV